MVNKAPNQTSDVVINTTPAASTIVLAIRNHIRRWNLDRNDTNRRLLAAWCVACALRVRTFRAWWCKAALFRLTFAGFSPVSPHRLHK